MRIYAKKTKQGFVIYKETLLQSLVSDLVTMMVMLFLIGLDVLFSIYITRSFIIDIAVIALLIFYLTVMGNKKQECKTKEEMNKIIEETFES